MSTAIGGGTHYYGDKGGTDKVSVCEPEQESRRMSELGPKGKGEHSRPM